MIATLICVSLSLMNSGLIFSFGNEYMLCNNVNYTVYNNDICNLYHSVLLHASLEAGECIPATALPSKIIYGMG